MYSDKLKVVAINLYNKIKSYKKVAELLNISKSIIHYWINYEYVPKMKHINTKELTIFVKKLLDKDC